MVESCVKCGLECCEPSAEVIRAPRTRQENGILRICSGYKVLLGCKFFDDSEETGKMYNVKHFDGTDGQKVVVKWIHSSHDCGYDEHLEYLRDSADVTASLLTAFENNVDLKGWKICVVRPLIVDGPEGKVIGLEPHIGTVKQFNSNTFWETDTKRTYGKIVLALSHFSYTHSDGEYVVVGLQGSVDKSTSLITLLGPILISDTMGKYGCTDSGHVASFMKYHVCNSICEDLPKL